MREYPKIIYYTKEGKFETTDANDIQLDDLHRTDGPAIELSNGIKAWYVNGERHRTDGPAVELADGTKAWFLYGVELTEEEHKRLMSDEKEYLLWKLKNV